jgi:hypothetical protein
MILRVMKMVLGIPGIEESWVYQDIFAKGEAKGKAEGALAVARGILLRLGSKKLGPPDEQVRSQIAASSDLNRLNTLIDGILKATHWDEFMAAFHA